MEIKKDILWRVYLCFLLIVALGVMVLGRAFYIQTFQGSYWRGMGDSLHLKYYPIEAERGSIYSADGNVLSTSVPIFDVYVDFGAEGLREKDGKRFTENIDSLCLNLADLFKDKTADIYKRELQIAYQRKERYYCLKKKISFEEYRSLRNFPLVRLGKNKSGFIIYPRDKRINPYVLFANRTVGLSRPDSTKNVGLEKTYNALLKGMSGQRLMRYTAGSLMPVEGAEVDPIHGKDIITTLDTYIQDVAETALMDMLVNNKSVHGTAIVMETETGQIKAIANLGIQKDGTYAEDLNYGIGKATEPGSVFKLATLACLLEDKYVDIKTKVDCEGGVKSFYGLRIRDSHKGTGVVDLKNAFTISSNVAFAKLAFQYYSQQPEKFVNRLHTFGLDTLTGIDIVATSGRPLIKKPTSKSWGATTIPYMAHGYEELVTPLHMLTFYNAVANGGKLMKPYLVTSVRDYGVEVQKIEPQVLNPKILSAETIAQLKECLRAVVDSNHGTAHRVMFDSAYSISGKTGTAVSAQNNNGYNKGNKIYQSSFIGFFPSEKPKYTMAVVIQNSRESKLIYGADVAGKVFKTISDKIYSRFLTQSSSYSSSVDSFLYKSFGMKTDIQALMEFMKLKYVDSAANGMWKQLYWKNNHLTATDNTPSSSNVMPDVTGMGLKDALYLLENKGLKIAANGKGRVISQSVSAGTAYSKGDKITLWLN